MASLYKENQFRPDPCLAPRGGPGGLKWSCSIWITIAIFVLALGTNAVAAEHPDDLYRQGKYKEAMAGYEKLDLDHPKDITYRFNRGCAAYQLKDYQSALGAYTSVYARAQDNTMRFKAAYNLGNTAFQAGDLQNALQYYKEALRLNPQDANTRYNLELTLRKIEQAKKQEQNQPQKDSGQQKQEQKNQTGQQQQGRNNQQTQSAPKNQEAEQDQQQKQQGKQDQGKDQPQQQPVGQQTAGRQQPQNLSGELKALSPAQQQKGTEQAQRQPAQTVEQKKAAALLDNIQEDRTRYLQLQVPEDKRGGVKSGKYW